MDKDYGKVYKYLRENIFVIEEAQLPKAVFLLPTFDMEFFQKQLQESVVNSVCIDLRITDLDKYHGSQRILVSDILSILKSVFSQKDIEELAKCTFYLVVHTGEVESIKSYVEERIGFLLALWEYNIGDHHLAIVNNKKGMLAFAFFYKGGFVELHTQGESGKIFYKQSFVIGESLAIALEKEASTLAEKHKNQEAWEDDRQSNPSYIVVWNTFLYKNGLEDTRLKDHFQTESAYPIVNELLELPELRPVLRAHLTLD